MKKKMKRENEIGKNVKKMRGKTVEIQRKRNELGF